MENTIQAPKSLFNSLSPRKAVSTDYLPAGTFLVEVMSITPDTPKHKYETFLDTFDLDNDGNPKVKRIADNYDQMKVVLAVRGFGATATHLSDRGNTKYKDLTADDVPADYDFSVLGISEAKARKQISENWDAIKPQMFFQSASGYAVRRDNHWRICDAVYDEDGSLARDEAGEHISGPQTKTAAEITEHAMYCMSTDQNGGIGNFCRITITKSNSKMTGNERTTIRFKDPVSKEEYEAEREALVG